jgi:hypothetical protein
MRGRAVPLSCHCYACRLDQVHELLVSGRIAAARLALEEAVRVVRLGRPVNCRRTGSIPWPEPPRAA